MVRTPSFNFGFNVKSKRSKSKKSKKGGGKSNAWLAYTTGKPKR
jgi:hypothetical protein